MIKEYQRIFNIKSLDSLFESTFHLKLNENRPLIEEELFKLEKYLFDRKEEFKKLYFYKLQTFIQENKSVELTQEDISFILHTPGMINRTGEEIYRGMILPAAGKYLKWKENQIISLTPKGEYISFSLNKKVAESFAFGGKHSKELFDINSEENQAAERNLRVMQNKHSHLIHIITQSKCPKYHLSIYDFSNVLSQLYNFYRKSKILKPSFEELTWFDPVVLGIAGWDEEILIFRPISMKIINLKMS